MNETPAPPKSYTEFTGSIPENYERYFVPLIFADYARLLERVTDKWAPVIG